MCVDDLKLPGRSDEDLENEIKILKTLSKDINITFGLQKCSKTLLKRVKSSGTNTHENTFEKGTKELDKRKAYSYLGIEDSHDTEQKNEKEKLKTKYLRRLRLILNTVKR